MASDHKKFSEPPAQTAMVSDHEEFSDSFDFKCCVTEYPQHLECPICLLLMKTPHVVSCCGKKFCGGCLRKLPSQECPICKQQFTSMLEKELERDILNLKINCNKEDCKWTGEIRELKAHLANDCNYQEVDCDLNCGLKIKRKDCTYHKLHECSKRNMEAQLASITYKLEERVIALEEIYFKQSQRIQELEHEILNLRMNSILPRFSLSTSPMNEHWYSPCFYTHHRGYKVRLKCNTTYPVWMGQYTVHCLLQLLCGEYDDTLVWPVTIEALVEVKAHHQPIPEASLIQFVLKTGDKPKPTKDAYCVAAESQTENLVVKFHQNRAIVGVAFYFAQLAVVSVSIKEKPKTKT